MKKVILLTIVMSAFSFSQLANLNGIKICIDPGHGGHNAGGVNSNDRRIEPDAGNVFWESEGNFQKALWLRPMLQGRGATVYLTRQTNDYILTGTEDNEPTLTERVAFANSNNVHYFHSIHSNATGGTNTNTNRTLMLIREKRPGGISSSAGNGLGIPEYDQSKVMADIVGPNIVAKNRTTSTSTSLDWTFYGGIATGISLGVLRGLTMPGELSEGSFHDYYPETRRLLNNTYRKGEAYGIYNGFVEYFKIPFDTLGLIIGTQKNGTVPLNNIAVRLLPLNKVYTGDAYNNGYFMFDSLAPGNYKVVYETPGYSQDTVSVVLSAVGRIASMSPTNNSVSVPRNAVVTCNFIKPMDTAFVRTVFSVYPPVDGAIMWNAENTVMTFTPKSLLGYKINYIVSLAGLGNTLQPTVFVDNKTVTSNVAAKPLSLSFTTVALPPSVQLTQPQPNDTNFSVTQNVGFRFSESMDTASVRAAFQITPSTVGTFTWTSTTSLFNTFLWKPVSGSLQYETNYTITIGSGAKSAINLLLDGNKDSVGGDQFVLQFRTQKLPSSVADAGSMPLRFTLEQNYPNPFNPTTVIGFQLSENRFTTLKIYDAIGREVATLVNDAMEAGIYSVQFDGTKLSSGIYFAKLTSGTKTQMRKLLLVK